MRIGECRQQKKSYYRGGNSARHALSPLTIKLSPGGSRFKHARSNGRPCKGCTRNAKVADRRSAKPGSTRSAGGRMTCRFGPSRALDKSGALTIWLYAHFRRRCNMSKTAVGLFENPGVADQVAHDLDASAFPRNEIRILGEPLSMAVTGTRVPHAPISRWV